MKIFKSMIIAFSIYSRIPMPHFEWKEEDMKYNLFFLPFVGIVIGVLVGIALYFGELCKLPEIALIALTCAMPLLITGGFHVDGFMDVSDALSSYKPREEKLKILKDPHIGAFSVIALLGLVCIWTAAVAVIIRDICDRDGKDGIRLIIILSLIFVLSRAMCAATALVLPKAKKEGMLNTETAGANKLMVVASAVQALAVLAVITCMQPVMGAAFLIGEIVFVIYYRHKFLRELGGVTGDSAGYFVTVNELVLLVLMAVVCVAEGFLI